MLLGSKLDLDHRREVSQEEGQKVGPQHMPTIATQSSLPPSLPPSLQFADNHDITFFYEVSAKTGHNVKEAFEAFFKDVHRKVSVSMGQHGPRQ